MADTTTQIELEILSKNFKKVEADLAKLSGQVDKLGKSAEKSKGFMSGFSQGLGDFSKLAIGAGAAGLAVAGLAKGIESMVAKEKSLAEFSAITGVTGEELKGFGDAATDLSNKFGTSTVDNIESFKGVLSRLGPDFAKSSNAVKIMGENINTLALASGMDATASMDALTTAMLQYGVSLKDPVQAAGVATEMMNVMAAGAKEGAAEIPQVSEALTQVGATAKSLNVSFVETNALLQSLAMGGKTGAEAGVALRNVMTSMVSGTTEANTALSKVGLSTKQLSATLTKDGANAAINQLKTGLNQLASPAEKAGVLVKVFGKENLAAAQTLINNADATTNFTVKLQGTNTATEQAAINMDTLANKSDRFFALLENTGVKLLEGTVQNLGGLGDAALSAGNAIENLLTGDFNGFVMKMSDSLDAATQSILGFRLGLTDSIKEQKKMMEQTNANMKADSDYYNLLIKQGKSQKDAYVLTEQNKKARQLGITLAQYQQRIDQQNFAAELKARGLSDEAIRQELALKYKMIEATEEQAKTETDISDKKKKSKTDKDIGIAGSLTFVNAKLSEAKQKLDKLVPNTSPWLAQKAVVDQLALSVRNLQVQSEGVTGLQAFDINTENIQKSMDELASPGILQAFSEQLPEAQLQMDTTVSWLDKIGVKLEEVGVGAQLFGETFGTVMRSGLSTIMTEGADTAEGMKELMKTVANAAITGAEALLFAGTAESFAKAVSTFGISLISDSPWLAAGFAALETGRAIVNSLAVGTPNVPYDNMPALLHKGETVVPKTFAQGVRDGEMTISGSGDVFTRASRKPIRVEPVSKRQRTLSTISRLA